VAANPTQARATRSGRSKNYPAAPSRRGRAGYCTPISPDPCQFFYGHSAVHESSPAMPGPLTRSWSIN
jgi:hypothetical protein